MAKIKSLKNGTARDEIVLKAATLFRKKGFNASSMRELGETLGVEASSLYNHIGSKSELLQSICFRTANAFQEHMLQVSSGQSNLIDKLELVIRFHIQQMLGAYDEVYVANHEFRYLDEPILSNYLLQRKQYENTLVALIEEGIQTGVLKQLHAGTAALVILAAVRGLEYGKKNRNKMNMQELENNMVQHLLYGLTKKN